MQIGIVNSYRAPKANYKNSETKPAPNEEKRNEKPDYNFSTKVMSTNAGIISFTGHPIPINLNLSKKISAGFMLLDNESILLIGKNLNKAKSELKDSINLFPSVIKKILFIQECDASSTIAIRVGSNGIERLVNIGEKPSFIKSSLGSDATISVKKGSEAALLEEDEIRFGATKFKVMFNAVDNFSKIREDFIQEIDLSELNKTDIKMINLRTLEKSFSNDQQKKGIMFSDVGGQDEAIEEIRQKVLRPIKYPNFFKSMSNTRSALFVGPPGNAKTLTAKALANEAGIPFYDLNGQLLEGKFVGESAEKINAYYQNAKNNQPCIIFFDEIEAILGKRSGKHKYADDSVNMHLDEISKIEKENAQVYLIGATNRPELIDDAALRAGRFGTKIEFKNPDTMQKCKDVFSKHITPEEIEDFNFDDLAQKMIDAKFSGADIAESVSNAKMNAIGRLKIFEAMDNGTFVDDPNFKLTLKGEDFEKALERKIKDKELVEKYAANSKRSRKDEIKEEIIAREEAAGEIRGSKPKLPKIGFNS